MGSTTLRDRMKQSRSIILMDYLAMMKADFETFVGHKVTMNESWFSYYYLEGRRRSMQWKYASFANTHQAYSSSVG